MQHTVAALAPFLATVFLACASLPEPKVVKVRFPREAFLEAPERRFEKVGVVRTRIDFPSLSALHEESDLCKNSFNRAVSDLVRLAKQKGADAVVEVRSVVFLMNGTVETYPRAECSDDGEGAQVLAQGIAVKWKPDPPKSNEPDVIPNTQLDDR